MTQTQQFDADVAAIEPEGQVTFQFEGKEWIGQKTPINSNLQIAEAGWEFIADFTLSVRLAQFAAMNITPPSEESTISIDGTDYRIATTAPDQYGVIMTYGVKQKT